MKLSREFIIRVKLNEEPAYRIAQRAGIHPNTLSKLLNGAERIKPADERVLSVAAVVGLSAGACFETEETQPVSMETIARTKHFGRRWKLSFRRN